MSASANTSCKSFTSLLKDFGFVIRDGASGGHKIATHPVIPLGIVEAANYNCGHNLGSVVSKPYVKKFLAIVNEHKEVLKEHLQ
jgi:hypothetical protein